MRLGFGCCAAGLALLLGCGPGGAAAPAPKSYYEILDIGRGASLQDVRRQFRKLSVRLHPDKNPAADTAQGRAAYAQLQRANEWLSNDDRRQLYDLYGEWGSTSDKARGHQFASQHSAIEFFRDEPLIKHVGTEVEAQQIFGLRAQRAYLMMLYVPWLTPCVDATEVYRKVANTLREETGEDGVRLAAVNCESNLQSFCRRYGRLRNQFELPVVLLIDPTDGLIDRYRGRLNAEELAEYTVASDKGIRHVRALDEESFTASVGEPADDSNSFWLVLFCTDAEPLCRDLKPVLKRLAYSAKDAARVGLVNCRQRRGDDGYLELEPFCQEQGVQDVPLLVAYRRGVRSEARGEVIPLLAQGEHGDPSLEAPLLALRAMEAVLRLSAPVAAAAAAPAGSGGGGGAAAPRAGEEL